MSEEMAATSLDEAWTRALADVRNPKLDGANPHFGNEFASLKSTFDPVKEQCREKGIRYEQREVLGDDGNRYLQTAIAGYGQERKLSVHPIIAARPNDSQAFGSALTYARRQVAQLDWGICGEADDDGVAASVQPNPEPQAQSSWESVKPLMPTKKDAYIARIEMYIGDCQSHGVKREGMDEWCQTMLGGKHLDDLQDMSMEELEKLGKYLGQLSKDSEALE